MDGSTIATRVLRLGCEGPFASPHIPERLTEKWTDLSWRVPALRMGNFLKRLLKEMKESEHRHRIERSSSSSYLAITIGDLASITDI